ncbi:MAG: alpha/beta hydrolase [Gemmatimonadaceae bacterium]|nr:alpha/beta hydrolase [Gemmatimonadaceae bacterium]
MRQTRRALVVLSVAVSWGCTEKNPSAPTTPLPALSMNNVHYGADAQQIMDVQLPAGRNAATAVVVFIHGGAWEGGDKSVFSPTDLSKFTARGYATVNINYRLASVPLNVHDPILSDDVTAALDYVASHANEYHVASATFAVVGHSAGAHLALLAAYRYNSQRRIKVVASLSGPTNFVDPAFLAVPSTQGIIERYLGVTFAAQPARWTGASPVSVATATSPPTILLHGRLDALVPYPQAEQLNARLLALRVPIDYRLFPNYNHDLNYVTLNHFGDDVWDPTLAWFATYLK